MLLAHPSNTSFSSHRCMHRVPPEDELLLIYFKERHEVAGRNREGIIVRGRAFVIMFVKAWVLQYSGGYTISEMGMWS